MAAVDPSGHTPECVLEDLEKAIQRNDEKSFNQYLAELERLLQDDKTLGERLTASGALSYAAWVESVPMMDTLIQKGVDINTKPPMERVVDEWAPLNMAARSGKVHAVRFLIEKGADVNIKGHWGRTPLYWATDYGGVDTVRCLVEKGANVNIRDDNGWTPLHVAARKGKIDAVRFLGDNGADLNIKDDDGNTPLHLAALNSCHNEVIYLVDKGADVNIRNHCGTTPLHMAAKKHHKGLEKYLVDHGADMNMKDGNDILEDLKKAILEGDVETFNQQLSEVEEVFQDHDSTVRGLAVSGALCYAARAGSIPMMDTLIQKGVDVNARLVDTWSRIGTGKDKGKSTPLHEAAMWGKVDTVRYLVEKGADVNIKDHRGRTPLCVAAQIGNVDMVRYLTDKGADVNIKDMDGSTSLHEAARSGEVDTVRYLIEKGADVNIKGRWGRTPLHQACHGGNAETLKYLLEKGADPTVTDDGGRNSLSWAIESRHKDFAVILLGHDKWKEMLRSSLWDTPLMRKLIAFMPDVAEVAFNRCVTTNEGEKDRRDNQVYATSDTLEVNYNYEFLEDFQDKHSPDSAGSWRPKKFTKYHHPLNLIRENDCSNLLKHPLVISLLEYKWTRFGRYIFFGNLFIYLIFLAFLTAFCLLVLSPLEKTCVNVLNGSLKGTAPENCGGLSIHEYRFLYVGAVVTILTALLRLALEIFQLCRHPLEYLLDWVNWLEIPLYLCSIIFTYVFDTPCLCVYSWQWQIGVVAVFLGWVGLIAFLQKWPVTGVYALMFVNILVSFMKIAFLALLLVIAFALAFYMLLFQPDEMRTAFSHPGRAIVKVMAMTTGELDYDELYHQQEGEDEIAFPRVSFLLWVIFLVLMPVLLSNLLVGLAVGDVDRLQRTASENKIELQIDLILSFEELLESLGIRHRFAIKPTTYYPNMPVTLLPQWCKGGTSDRDLVSYPDVYETGRLAKVRKWIAKWYSKLWITDEYSTSGVKISDAIKPPPESLEKQLQKQRQQLEAKLQEHSEQFQTKLREQSEQLEAKLNKHSEKQNEQFQEAVRQLSENNKEQAKKSEEQAKKMEERTKQLAGEVASLREALEKLVTQMAAK